jgi:hypothetical protein
MLSDDYSSATYKGLTLREISPQTQRIYLGLVLGGLAKESLVSDGIPRSNVNMNQTTFVTL